MSAFWFAPVYDQLTIQVGGEHPAEMTLEVASVYTHMVQTGGGLDVGGKTVTVVCLYGIGNIDKLSLSDVCSDATYYYACREGEGREAAEKLYLKDDGNGGYTVTGNKEEATAYPADGLNLQLLDRNIFSANDAGSAEADYNGETYTYTFTRIFSYGNAIASILKDPNGTGMKPLPAMC